MNVDLMVIVAVIVAVILLIAAAWFGRTAGRALKRGVGFAMAILGVGVVFDPPTRHGVESVEDDRDGQPGKAGDPH